MFSKTRKTLLSTRSVLHQTGCVFIRLRNNLNLYRMDTCFPLWFAGLLGMLDMRAGIKKWSLEFKSARKNEEALHKEMGTQFLK